MKWIKPLKLIMNYMFKKLKLFLLINILLIISGCSTKSIQSEAQLSPIVTMEEAIEIAKKHLLYDLKIKSFDPNSAKVLKSSISIKSWTVTFKKLEELRPPNYVLIVNKKTGSTQLIPLK